MGATPSLAGGPRSARRPSPAPPRPVRWPRRIAGVLATGALIAVAVATYGMLAPDPDPDPDPAPTARPAVAAPKPTPRAQAVALLRSRGFVPVDADGYSARHALRVMIGRRAGRPAGTRRAFFFAGGRFAGTDAAAGSTGLEVAASGRRWVTLAYGRYAVGDKPCCPSGGRAKVRFDLRDGKVRPARPLPGESARVATR
jgi:hypothetical protein